MPTDREVPEETTPVTTPSLSDQVSRLYDIIGGYHAAHMLQIAHELGVWKAVASNPGLSSGQLATQLGTEPFYTDVLCRTAFAYSILARDGAGWRMAPHFDQILGDPNATFFLGTAARVHVKVGEDYKDYAQHFREGTRSSYQAHDGAFMEDVALATASLPRIFLDFVLPQLPALQETLSRGERLFDLGCGGGWAVTQIAERFPNLRCIGADVEPYSVDLAQTLIRERNLEDRCEARVGSAEVAETGLYDAAVSFLVIHEIAPESKAATFANVARALKSGGAFLIFDEAYPETDEDLQHMPKRFAALAQWYEVTWGNRVNTRTELIQLCEDAGLEIASETGFSRFHIVLATKR